MRRRFHTLSSGLTGLLLFALWCCLPVSAIGGYTVGPGDQIEIRVSGEEDLSGLFTVSNAGTIAYPLVGVLRVDGLSSSVIASLVREELKDGYLVSPEVVVYVKTYASKKVAILGDVPSPGFYVLKDGSSLMSMLAEAGMALKSGNGSIIITPVPTERPTPGGKTAVPRVVSIETLLNPWQEQEPVSLSPGDRVFVQVGGGERVVVSGKVRDPGVVLLGDGLTALEAINQAGGPAEFGSLKGVKVVRESEDGSDVIRVDLSAVLEGDRSQDVALRDGDIVIVPRRWF